MRLQSDLAILKRWNCYTTGLLEYSEMNQSRIYPPPCHRGKSLNLWGYGQR